MKLYHGSNADIDRIDLTPSADGKTWTLAATPAFDLELEVEYENALALSETKASGTKNKSTLNQSFGDEALSYASSPNFFVDHGGRFLCPFCEPPVAWDANLKKRGRPPRTKEQQIQKKGRLSTLSQKRPLG